MRNLETEIHSQEVSSWAAVYCFNYRAQYDALVVAYGQAKADAIAATLRFIEHYGYPPKWAAYAPKVNAGNDDHITFTPKEA